MNTIEASKSTLSIKKKLFEMSKSISPEMHAFTKLSLPKVFSGGKFCWKFRLKSLSKIQMLTILSLKSNLLKQKFTDILNLMFIIVSFRFIKTFRLKNISQTNLWIFNMIMKIFSKDLKWSSQSIEKSNNKIKNERISEEELKQLKETEASQQPETPEEIDPVGFRKVLDYLTELQLPLVVHNGFLDMCHVKFNFLQFKSFIIN